MALTSEQEEILEQIIEAYENGKRLSDLPDVGDTNPIDLYCEVMDTDGESKKARLAALLPYVEDEVAYGVEKDKTDSATTWTRVGNLNLHKTLPIHNGMKGCLLNDDGTPKEYLSQTDWRNNTLDGSRGQVMVEVPMIYAKFTEVDNVQRIMMSQYPLPGYTQYPKFYISAYEATVQRSTNKLSSVKNEDADYRGGNNNADRDGTEITQLGMPASSISLTNFRTYARNRGTAGKDGCGWNCNVYWMYKIITWLYIIEYANSHVQAAFNAELTSEGYHQGGLGSGVTTLNGDSWNAWNGYYAFIPCGYTDELGNGTGVVEYTMPDGYGTALTVQVPRYRGIENLFGHLHKWTDGILVVVNPSEDAGGNGLSQIYACNEPAKFSSTSVDDYSFIGNQPREDNYIKEIQFGEGGDIMALELGGSSTTYFPDRNYGSSVDVTSPTIRGVLFGGRADVGANAGLFFASSYYAPSYTSASRGSRLCFLPE